MQAQLQGQGQINAVDIFAVARRLEDMGVAIVRGGFASWVRDDLGLQASDEHVDRAFRRVGREVATGHSTTVQELTHVIAAELPSPPGSHIDAFGGSAWTID